MLELSFLVAAISIAGMSVAFPIGGGIGWTLGILINYIGKPEGNPSFLFTGTAFIVLAILLSMQSYKKLATQQKKPTLDRYTPLICGRSYALHFFTGLSPLPWLLILPRLKQARSAHIPQSYFFRLEHLSVLWCLIRYL